MAARTGIDLYHHGDQDLARGLIDFAVNVRAHEPPPFIVEGLRRSVPSWAAYPDARPAAAALAERWGVPPEMVLPTSGAAEAFTLIAQALPGELAVVVHPQFTEPEAALRRVGRRTLRAILGGDFTLRAEAVTQEADRVFVGNPTNPTGVLHPRRTLLALARPGRVLVVDEAFLDEVGDEHSLISDDMSGLLVVRSLTKVFAAAGVRAGYVVGDPELIDLLRRQQTPWSVSSPAIELMRLACGEAAREYVARIAAELPALRADLVTRLRELGLRVVESSAPFVLADTAAIRANVSLRGELNALGIAVRRGETFPGLGPTWLRLAVRTPELHSKLADALARIKEAGC